jgi:hypothetical protein
MRYAGPLLLALTALSAQQPGRAQEEPLTTRMQQVAGVDAAAAEAFLDTLRRHVGQDDRTAVCSLVAYPLPQPGQPVANAAACEARYDQIFTMAVRKAVGRQQFNELFVNETGIMIGNGELWFATPCPAGPCAAPSLRIIAVNGAPGPLTPPRGKVMLACHAGGQFVQVVADGGGGAEFRSWLAAHPEGSPALVLRSVNGNEPAGGQCGSRAWRFADGSTSYLVSDLGCDAYLAPPPMGSVGKIVVEKPGAPRSQTWCFE